MKYEGQIAKTFDRVTIGKIKRSAMISLAGWAVVAIPFLVKEINDLILQGDVIDWRTPLVMLTSAIGAWGVNTLKEWRAGEE